MESFDKTEFYTPPCFDNSYSARQILEYNLSDKAKADKEAIDEAVSSYITDEAFDEWYDSFCQALNEAINK